jgi:hypothetical protein
VPPHPRPQQHTGPHVERTDPLGRLKLMPRHRQQVHAEGVHIDRHLAHRLGGVGMHPRRPQRARRARAATGWIVPISLLANIPLTTAVRSSMRRSAAPSRTTPRSVDREADHLGPLRREGRALSATAGCSMAQITTHVRRPDQYAQAPRIA